LIRVYRGIESVASDDGLQRAAFRAGDGGGVVQLIAALFGEEWFFFLNRCVVDVVRSWCFTGNDGDHFSHQMLIQWL
jgi:hypothetical protein